MGPSVFLEQTVLRSGFFIYSLKNNKWDNSCLSTHKAVLIFVTFGHLMSGSEIRCYFDFALGYSYLNMRSRLCQGNAEGGDQYVCQREPRTDLCFPNWGAGKFHPWDKPRAQEAFCVFRLRFPVTLQNLNVGSSRSPSPMSWLAGQISLPVS